MLIIAAEVTEPLDFTRRVRALNHAGGGYAVCVSERVDVLGMLPQAYVQAEVCVYGPLRGLYRYAPRQPEFEALLSELPLELERIKAQAALLCAADAAAHVRAVQRELLKLGMYLPNA